jgi:hypothetical protein
MMVTIIAVMETAILFQLRPIKFAVLQIQNVKTTPFVMVKVGVARTIPIFPMARLAVMDKNVHPVSVLAEICNAQFLVAIYK